MRHLLLLLPLIVASCGDADSKAPAVAVQSPCVRQSFEGSGMTVCSPGSGKIQLFAAARDQPPLRNFSDVETALAGGAHSVAFAMNAGMFGEHGRPIGLAIVEGKQVRAVNRRKGGGNFHLMPNGIFQVDVNGRAEVVATSAWTPSPDIRTATQSGPMLVIAGRLHPAFDHDGSSRHIRNGVGIAADGQPLFVISEDAVSLGKFARFFRDRLKCRDALFFDGAVSALWDPANHRRDITVPLGPILVAFKPAPSAPGREAHATP